MITHIYICVYTYIFVYIYIFAKIYVFQNVPSIFHLLWGSYACYPWYLAWSYLLQLILGAPNPLVSHHFPHEQMAIVGVIQGDTYPRGTKRFYHTLRPEFLNGHRHGRGSLWITWPTSCGFGQPSFGSLAEASSGEDVFMSCFLSSMLVSNRTINAQS